MALDQFNRCVLVGSTVLTVITLDKFTPHLASNITFDQFTSCLPITSPSDSLDCVFLWVTLLWSFRSGICLARHLWESVPQTRVAYTLRHLLNNHRFIGNNERHVTQLSDQRAILSLSIVISIDLIFPFSWTVSSWETCRVAGLSYVDFCVCVISV